VGWSEMTNAKDVRDKNRTRKEQFDLRKIWKRATKGTETEVIKLRVRMMNSKHSCESFALRAQAGFF